MARNINGYKLSLVRSKGQLKNNAIHLENPYVSRSVIETRIEPMVELFGHLQLHGERK